MSCIFDYKVCKYNEDGACLFPMMGSGYPYDAPCFGVNIETDGPDYSSCKYAKLGPEEYPCNICCQNVNNDDEGQLTNMFEEAEKDEFYI